MLRVHTIPHSTNADRVGMAAAHKGVEIQWVLHQASDRGEIVRVSGQELVPVVEVLDSTGTPTGEVITDSPVILRWLEDHFPEPALWPKEPAKAAAVDVFIDWFNRVWKVPPNALADNPGSELDAQHVADLARWRDFFEGLLTGGDYLFGEQLSVADIVAFPFLSYASTPVDPHDSDPFHAVLREHANFTAGYPAVAAWIDRMSRLPGAAPNS